METPTPTRKQNRAEIVDAMARAAWWASGEPHPWEELPNDVRQEWRSYQDAALQELENRIPEIRRLLDG
jgi:hypothetical protein